MKGLKHREPAYSLGTDGDFTISNFNYSKPLANFFPGIAGKYGIPMWVFYVNRGQAVSSFGTNGKDNAILEFYSANKAWQLTSLLGFRTFILAARGKKQSFYEPFHNGLANKDYDVENFISMSSYDLKLREVNRTLGLEVSVEYFTVPQESFAALARRVTVSNIARSAARIKLLDGLPQIVPFGDNNWCLKEISRTIEAWMRVENLEKGVPVFKLAVDPGDRPQVIHLREGNFYLGFTEQGKKTEIIKPIVDPDCVFGAITDFSVPRNFVNGDLAGYPSRQQIESKTPCAFLPLEFSLGGLAKKSFNAVIGNVRDTKLVDDVRARVTVPGYLDAKALENKQIILSLQEPCRTESALATFDLYCGQTFLDNILRGGTPQVFSDGSREKVYYLYSRKHGDLERDYNRFQIQPAYFSQGNGNYRDINQNRRCDGWFNPSVGDFNLRVFFDLIQADGFNPLVVKGATFVLKDERIQFERRVTGVVQAHDLPRLLAFIEKPFTPGELVLFMRENAIEPSCPCDSFLDMLLPLCQENSVAEHSEGFWIDHWQYNLDLLENHLALFPEKVSETLLGERCYTFYDSEAVVLPRSSKYVLLDGKPRQLHSVRFDERKKELLASRTENRNLARSANGKGDIYRTTLCEKLICLFVNKYASLDPSGIGIEMEADKPGWYDSLNGLPALFGSSTCETFQLKRLCRLLIDGLTHSCAGTVSLAEEIAWFFTGLAGLTGEYAKDGSDSRDFTFWDKSVSLKEEYRQKILLGFSGAQTQISSADIIAALKKAMVKIDDGLARAFDAKRKIYYTYFINEVTDFESSGGRVKPKKFRRIPLPFFLEGQMHALRMCEDRETARRLWQAVRTSGLYDGKLKMYKVCDDLKDMPEEIGRCRVFTPGWLENQSIWLHMEYKWLLEMLKQGLAEEFFDDFRSVLIPFQKPEVYGRSVLENSSFLVSSAFPYKELHGNGFVARLSGSTAEFLQMWNIMNAGLRPFTLDEKGELALVLSPLLAGWLFRKKEKTYSFNFLGTVPVTYHNPLLKDTFSRASKAARTVLAMPDGSTEEFPGSAIPAPFAQQVRAREVKSIDVYFE